MVGLTHVRPTIGFTQAVTIGPANDRLSRVLVVWWMPSRAMRWRPTRLRGTWIPRSRAASMMGRSDSA